MSDDISLPPVRATLGFMLRHPAHWIGIGFGSGLAPRAPGTVGTLWGWASFAVLNLWLSPLQWGWLIAASLVVGWWACTVTARHMRTCDPGAVVWDEIVAIWLILWLVMPAGFWWQLAAFGVFRYFDAAKPGPVRWADGLFKIEPGKPVTVWQGFGILFDDLVAAGCTLVVLAVAKAALPLLGG
ncbi:phosphatidylglycerophosphatase A [Roseateles sp.]|uniref:phosphatidylglycerophosphatase A family protein n=1 Tax=Roseateles sp. TaxID=1971397 RepID=UPI0031E191B5